MLHFRGGGQWMGRQQVDFSHSLWRDRNSQLWSFICPLCKIQRKVKFRPQPGGFSQVAKVMISAAFVTLLLWPWLHFKGIVSFVPLWTGFELVYRWRRRA